MKQVQKMLCAVLCAGTLLPLGGCVSPKEQEEIDAANKEKALEIAKEYFGEEFEYDFDFYGGSGGGPAQDIYVFTDGDTIHCVALPVKENAPGPYVHYDCTLHQYSGGYWSLQDYEDTVSLD